MDFRDECNERVKACVISFFQEDCTIYTDHFREKWGKSGI